jgi:hypothetical protein
MTKINRSTDCGNSPKNKLVEDIGIAFELADTDFLSAILDFKAEWNYTNGSKITAEKVLATLTELDKPVSLTIDHVMSHGKVGAVNGKAKRRESEWRFCYVNELTTTKCNRIKRIESFGG